MNAEEISCDCPRNTHRFVTLASLTQVYQHCVHKCPFLKISAILPAVPTLAARYLLRKATRLDQLIGVDFN